MNNILEVNNLSITFGENQVLHNLSFSLKKGQTLGIVGESGSGKSISSLAIMGLLNKKAILNKEASILFNNTKKTNLLSLSKTEYKQYRGNQISMIFQEPMTSLNPSLTCGKQVKEIIDLHLNIPTQNAKKRVLELFEKVLLPKPERIYNAYPHELSGGQKQRVMIAMAIACEPKILIADEPTTALDVTVQKSILQLLKQLQEQEGMSMIFISHDLGVIAEVCDDVLVMFRGKKVESGSVKDIFKHPKQDYTKGLIACRPSLNVRYKKLPVIEDFLNNPNHQSQLYSPQQRADFHAKIYNNPPLLEVKDLSKFFYPSSSVFSKKPQPIKAVNQVNFKVYKGETLGLVGESGSGKTTLSRATLLLEPPTSGHVFFNGKDITKLSKNQVRELRKDIQIIFQDPYSSLNPRATVQQILCTPMQVHQIVSSQQQRINRAKELLEKVGLKASDLQKYPHEFSGGQRQRIGIARAICLNPKLIICDESVSALDVSVQAQVLNLLNDLKQEFKLTYIFISHDLAVVKYMSDQLVVLQHGTIQETGDADLIYQNPSTQYTKNLINAIPKIN